MAEEIGASGPSDDALRIRMSPDLLKSCSNPKVFLSGVMRFFCALEKFSRSVEKKHQLRLFALGASESIVFVVPSEFEFRNKNEHGHNGHDFVVFLKVIVMNGQISMAEIMNVSATRSIGAIERDLKVACGSFLIRPYDDEWNDLVMSVRERNLARR